jgi:hypothetical protein
MVWTQELWDGIFTGHQRCLSYLLIEYMLFPIHLGHFQIAKFHEGKFSDKDIA